MIDPLSCRKRLMIFLIVNRPVGNIGLHYFQFCCSQTSEKRIIF